jgi:exopolysaccharide biosynthesis polyprenyl glycosylphosphotransferase
MHSGQAMQRIQRKRTLYMLGDALACLPAWTLFFLYRKSETPWIYNQLPWHSHLFNDSNYLLGLLVLPIFWLSIHALSGYYKEVDRKSRLMELFRTFLASMAGGLILFFFIILDDTVFLYTDYYRSLAVLIGLQFGFTWIPRVVQTSRYHAQIRSGRLTFPTLLLGDIDGIKEVQAKLNPQRFLSGTEMLGYLSAEQDPNWNELPWLGKIDQLEDLLNQQPVDDVVICFRQTDHVTLQQLISRLHLLGVRIRIRPDLYDITSGTVRFSNIFETPLMEVHALKMPPWQQFIKRALDIAVSGTMLVLLAPLYLFIALRVKLDSRGPVFYNHERIGLNGKSFKIFKFRSMVVNAESHTPRLSSDSDRRITPWGRTMRKYRLDELPQFYNVLRGDMSLVGPRPERAYFIEQITQVAPHYRLLHRVKPGITSWGQVKFGYAENIDEMVERLKFDLLYIHNASLLLDLKIMLHTFLIVVRGEGK